VYDDDNMRCISTENQLQLKTGQDENTEMATRSFHSIPDS